MLGAFQRSAVIHALRTSTRTISARSCPQRFQSLPPSVLAYSYASRSLFHSSSFRFNSQATVAATNGAQVLEQGQPGLPTRFQELADMGLVHRPLIDNLRHLKDMTEVQCVTIPVSLKGGDILAQAKTGTGKTLAFLIPVVQKILSDPSVKLARRDRYSRRSAGDIDIRAIIVSPTRELAEQISVEAKRLTSRTGLVVQTAVGGTQKRQHLMRIRQEGCHILVATPGRLRDVLADPHSDVEAPKLSSFVLDEADRLLDDGFAPALMEIQNLLPDPAEVDRQTLMFSATVPSEVMGMVRNTMKPNFDFIKTVNDNEAPTHLSVPQKAVVLRGFENTLAAILELAKNNLPQGFAEHPRPFKAIVYFNATKQVSLAYKVFNRLLNDPENFRSGHPLGRMYLGEISSLLSQQQRTRVSDWFRKCQSGILFSSDVTARGMDFPDVTHVIQVGVPRDRETYIHRLGRTARANKTGEGWIFLHEGEMRHFKQLVRDIPVDVDKESLITPFVDLRRDIGEIADEVRGGSPEGSQTLQQIHSAVAELPIETKEDACTALLATTANSFRDKHELGRALNDLAVHGYGLRSIPRISSTLASKLGFGRADGLRIRTPGKFARPDARPDRRSNDFRRDYDRDDERNYRSSRGRQYSDRKHVDRW